MKSYSISFKQALSILYLMLTIGMTSCLDTTESEYGVEVKFNKVECIRVEPTDNPEFCNVWVRPNIKIEKIATVEFVEAGIVLEENGVRYKRTTAKTWEELYENEACLTFIKYNKEYKMYNYITVQQHNNPQVTTTLIEDGKPMDFFQDSAPYFRLKNLEAKVQSDTIIAELTVSDFLYNDNSSSKRAYGIEVATDPEFKNLFQTVDPTHHHHFMADWKRDESANRVQCCFKRMYSQCTYYLRGYCSNVKLHSWDPLKFEYTDTVEVYVDSPVHHEDDCAVDLGLSVLWSTHNYGAKTPEDMGEKMGDKETYYPRLVCNIYVSGFYNSNAEPYDEIKNKWGGGWRLPSKPEFNELKTKCKWEYDESKKCIIITGPNQNTIYFPIEGDTERYWTQEKRWTDGRDCCRFYRDQYFLDFPLVSPSEQLAIRAVRKK